MRRSLIETLCSEPASSDLDRLISSHLTERDLLEVVTDLRSRYDREVASAIAETALLRIRARAKFPNPDHMLFDRLGLEQASAHAVALHRVGRLPAADLILDLGCGIGGDAMALTNLAPVVGLDTDPGRLRLAAHNCEVAGGVHRFHPVLADVMTFTPPVSSVVFADPGRRAGGRRLRGLASYLPPVDLVIDRWRHHTETMAIKVAPGIEGHEVPDGAAIEWVSLDGALREAVIWIGGPGEPGERRATVLPSGASITGPEPDDIPIAGIDRYLHEPDDAVVRAGLVRCVAVEIGASLIDPAIAYLTSPAPADHPMVTSHRIDEVMAFNLKRLRSRLAELDVGVVTIKKRGSPLTPEELRPRLRLRGSRSATLFLTRTADGPLVGIGLDDEL